MRHLARLGRGRGAVVGWWVAALAVQTATLAETPPQDLSILPAEQPRVRIPRVPRPPRLEEFLGMEPPAELESHLLRIQGFVQQDPADGEPASQRTHVYLGYDTTNLYVVFMAFDDEPELIRAHLRRREQPFPDETVEIQLDTFNDRRRALSFLTNPFGVQWDALWTEAQGFDPAWDTVWASDGELTDRGYVVLMSLPFKSLRFKPADEQVWGIVLVRDIPRNNEVSFWPRVSNRIEGRLNQEATLEGLRDVSPGRNLWLIPYATARTFETVVEPPDEDRAEIVRESFDPKAGMDLKWVIRDRMAFDFTLHPDYSQIESDQPQVTVNQRFEVFFPERRPFFLENANYFETPIDLLFTRRIADPLVGARLTGKVGPWALGTFLIDDEAPGQALRPDDPLHGERAKFGVLRFSRDILNQSTLGVMYTERRFDRSRNRVGGIDGRIKLGSHWDTRFQAVQSQTRDLDGLTESDSAFDVSLNRSGRKLGVHLHYIDIGPEFRAEAGFVPRTDIRNAHANLNYRFRPQGKWLVAWGPSLGLERIYDHEGTRLDRFVRPEMSWEFRRQTHVGMFARVGRERLRPRDFPTLTEDTDYRVNTYAVFFDTRFWRWLSLNTTFSFGRGTNFAPPQAPQGQDPIPPFSGDARGVATSLLLQVGRRLQIDNTYYHTRLEEPSSGRRIFTDQIFRSRWAWQFDTRLSLRAIVQVNDTDTDPELTAQETRRNFNGDVLVTYLINPWTAVYAGVNTNYRNFDLVDNGGLRQVVLTDGGDLGHDSHQVFVKVTYLFRP